MYYLENAQSSTTSISVPLLFYSLSYFIGAAGFLLFKVLAARRTNFSNARARKNKYTARMLADARKDHSINTLNVTQNESAKRVGHYGYYGVTF